MMIRIVTQGLHDSPICSAMLYAFRKKQKQQEAIIDISKKIREGERKSVSQIEGSELQ